MADGQDEPKRDDDRPNLAGEARESYRRARESAYEFQSGLLRTIREKPVKSVLYAAGIGFVIGALFSRGGRR